MTAIQIAAQPARPAKDRELRHLLLNWGGALNNHVLLPCLYTVACHASKLTSFRLAIPYRACGYGSMPVSEIGRSDIRL